MSGRILRFMWPVLVLTPPLFGGDDANTAALDVQQILATMSGGVAEVKEDGAGLPDFEEVTKGMVSTKGLFTLWRYPPDAKDKESEKLLCQIPSGMMGEQFMLSTSFSGGGFFTGFPLDERVVKWAQQDRQLLLIEPETRFVVDGSKEVADVVRRTYPDRIRTAVPLVTKAPNGDPVIDLGPMLKSSFANIGWTSLFDGRFRGGGINRSLSRWTKVKSFPLNVEIGVELAVGRASPPGSYDKKLVHYSFWKLPQTDYQPRVADDRIGYFLTANQDWAKPTESRDIFNRYVDRWYLAKRDPSLRMCEPKKPITFYIEKTVPVRFRRAVRDGILEWNKAFEKVGLVNAVEVRQQTADNEWKDLDPEDMRYSFFRWIVTGAGFAMGPHRANPFTGQIYDADIIFDDAMVRFFEQEAQMMLPGQVAAGKFRDPALHAFLEQCPEWKRPRCDWDHFEIGEFPDPDAIRQAMHHRMRDGACHVCDYVDGMKHQMALAQAVLAGQPPEVAERFLYDVVKEVVMHEVGHTLGLRHNFAASTIYTIDEIQKRRETGEATVGSVMDYNPILFFAKNATDGHFITPTLGPYDYWAIEYGYRPFDGKAVVAGTPAKETEGDEKAAASEPAAAQAEVTTSAGVPQALLDKLPPEVREMIASGGIQITAGTGGDAGGAKTPSEPVTAAPPSGEAAMLQAIASRAAEPELVYATDEDTTFLSPDPRSNRFDMGHDPIDWAETRIALIDERMANILKWAVKDKESWYHARQAFLRLLVEKCFVMDYVGRYIGGQYFNRAHRGDADAQPPFIPVDAKTQRAALSFIEKHLFSDDFFAFSPEVLNHLAPPRWWHNGARVSYTIDFPIHNYIGLLQWWNLFDRVFPNTLRRIHDAELKTTEPDRLTVAEYLRRLQTACWADACSAKRAQDGNWSDGKPFVSDVRRSLQREYLGLMERLVRTPPGLGLSPDIRAMVQHSLRTLSDQLGQVMKSGQLDFASAAHLGDCQSRIDRMLAPELREYGSGG